MDRERVRKNLRPDRRIEWAGLNSYIKSKVNNTSRNISGNNRSDFAYLKAQRKPENRV